MVSVLLTWIVILFFSYVLGMTAIGLIYPGRRDKSDDSVLSAPEADECIWFGLAVLTVYAQTFSVFYRVGIMAVVLIGLLTAVCFLYLLIRRRDQIGIHLSGLRQMNIGKWCAAAAVLLAMIAWTNTAPEHYDTYLYHNQAIQWIERYGTVKGLGNLHFRFAYNSAFMPLQALFSFRGITGQSLHTVNGFASLFMLIYCVTTLSIWNRRSPVCADYIKLAVIAYVYYNRHLISSPGTDAMPMYLFLYICFKWCEYNDKYKESDTGNGSGVRIADRYAVLCMLAVYNITLKLSVAPLILLAAYPVYVYIRSGNTVRIIRSVVTGTVIGLPWIMRNFLISGYLVYPITGLDIFNVDWKMPSSVADWDNWEIKVWGRGSMDPYLHDESFFEWFPYKWFGRNPGVFNRVCMVLGILLALMLLVYLIYKIVKRSIGISECILDLSVLVSFTMWLFTAPLIRYGAVFTYVLLAIWLGILSGKKHKYEAAILSTAGAVICLLIVLTGASVIGKWEEIGNQPLIMQQDYEQRETKVSQYDGFDVWFPVNGDQCGTDVFPSVPGRRMVDMVTLRGAGIEDGFRIKDEYTGLCINGEGVVY